MEYLHTGARHSMSETIDAFETFRSRSAAPHHQPRREPNGRISARPVAEQLPGRGDADAAAAMVHTPFDAAFNRVAAEAFMVT